MPAPKIAGTIRSKNPLKGAVEVLPVRNKKSCYDDEPSYKPDPNYGMLEFLLMKE